MISLRNLDCLRLEVESEVQIIAFGDHQYSGLLGSPRLAPCAAIFAAFSSLDRLGQRLLLGRARWGGRASNTLRRQVLGAGYLFYCATTESCPASGIICTWPASPGLEVCREEGYVGKGRKEDSQQRKPAGVAMLGKASGAIHTGKKLESGWEEGRMNEGK